MCMPAMPAMAATRTAGTDRLKQLLRGAVWVLVLWLAGCAHLNSPAGSDSGTAIDSQTGRGVVTEVLTAGRYQYVCVNLGSRGLWMATEPQDIRVGDTVQFGDGLLMKEFRSDGLSRVFPEIVFVSHLEVVARPQVAVQLVDGLPSGHPMIPTSSRSEAARSRHRVPGALPAVAGTVPMARILADPEALNGSDVAVVGMVSKVNVNIMGRNWVHLLDEAGRELVVTTSASVRAGDLVVAKGKLSAGRLFESGYFFRVLLEEARLEALDTSRSP